MKGIWMKGARAVIPTLLLSLMSLSFCQAQEKTGWEALDLKQETIDGAILYYESSLADKLDVFRRVYAQILKAQEERIEQRRALLEKSGQIINELNRIVGGTVPQDQEKQQAEMFERFFGVLEPVLCRGDIDVTLYFVTQETVKVHLRGGGSLPDFTYSKASDTASYNFLLTEQRRDASLAILVPLTGDVQQHVREAFFPISGMTTAGAAAGIALHELAEIAIHLRLKPSDPYCRWFGDGFANAIAIHLLTEYLGDAQADEFAQGCDASKYRDLEKEINLAYWMSVDLAIETPFEKEKRLKLARYAYATSEARRLIDEYGIACVSMILNEMEALPKRTSESLCRAIKEVTGEDIAARLKQYQQFKTRREGLENYTTRYNEALGRKDYATCIELLLRVRELRKSYDVKDYSTAAYFLWRVGEDTAADAVIADHLAMLKKRGQEKACSALRQLVLDRALAANRSDRVDHLATEVLRSDPDNVLALAVRMMTLSGSGDAAEAREIARRILEVDKSPDSLPRRLAEDLLKEASEE